MPPVERICTPRRAQLVRELEQPVPCSETLTAGRAGSAGFHRSGCSLRPMPYSRSFLRSVPRLMPRMSAARLWLPADIVEHGAEQRLFDFAQHQVVQVAGAWPLRLAK